MANQDPKNSKEPKAQKDSSEIFQPPRILRHPASRQVELGGKVLLRVVATGLPLPSYQWFHNGTKIGGANSNSLAINRLRRLNGGTYHCEVSNFVGKVTSQAAVISFLTERLSSPVIEPAELFVQEGKPISIRLASLSPEKARGLKIFWTFNGKRIKDAHGLELRISEAKKKYQGVYKAMISAGSNLEASNPVQVTVMSGASAAPAPPAPEPRFEPAPAPAAEESFFFDPEKEESAPSQLELASPEMPADPGSLALDPDSLALDPESLVLQPDSPAPDSESLSLDLPPEAFGELPAKAAEPGAETAAAPPKEQLSRKRNLLERLKGRFRKLGEEKSGLIQKPDPGKLKESA